jgi:hypothetical protein
MMLSRNILGVAMAAIAAGGAVIFGASRLPVEDGQIAQTPLIDKDRNDQNYQQRLDAEKARSDAAAAAARAAAEDDARRRAADLVRQQSEDATRQQQLNNLDRYRSDQPQPFIRR